MTIEQEYLGLKKDLATLSYNEYTNLVNNHLSTSTADTYS